MITTINVTLTHYFIQILKENQSVKKIGNYYDEILNFIYVKLIYSKIF